MMGKLCALNPRFEDTFRNWVSAPDLSLYKREERPVGVG
jgi:hypothetical protein